MPCEKNNISKNRFWDICYFKEKQDVLLSNTANKQLIMNVISTELKKARCCVFHSHDDADVDIVKAAVQSSLKCPATVTGGEMDLILLLLYHADVISKPF